MLSLCEARQKKLGSQNLGSGIEAKFYEPTFAAFCAWVPEGAGSSWSILLADVNEITSVRTRILDTIRVDSDKWGQHCRGRPQKCIPLFCLVAPRLEEEGHRSVMLLVCVLLRLYTTQRYFRYVAAGGTQGNLAFRESLEFRCRWRFG